MTKLRAKLNRYLTDYLDPKVVMVMDFLLSMLASFIVLFVANYATKYGPIEMYGTRTFAFAYLSAAFVATVVACVALKPYRLIIRRSTIRDIARLSFAILVKEAALIGIMFIWTGAVKGWPLVIMGDTLLSLLFILGIRVAMLGAYDFFKSRANELIDRQRVLVYGTSDKSASAATRPSLRRRSAGA